MDLTLQQQKLYRRAFDEDYYKRKVVKPIIEVVEPVIELMMDVVNNTKRTLTKVNNDDHKIHITVFDNTFDNTADNSLSTNWREFKEFMSTKQNLETKEDAVSFNCWRFNEVDYKPALHGDDTVKLDENGNTMIGRYAENCIETTAVVLDFDGALSIDNAKKRFRKFEHFGYTTFKHKAKSIGFKERFRIILPFAVPVPTDHFRLLTKSILKWSGVDDLSTLYTARIYYGHGSPASRQFDAETWSNSGKLLNSDMFDKEVIVDHGFENMKKRLEREAKGDTSQDSTREWLMKMLPTRFLGFEPTWASVANAMYNEGFTLSEFTEVTVGGMMSEKTAKDCEKKWNTVRRSSKKLGLGLLVNIASGKK